MSQAMWNAETVHPVALRSTLLQAIAARFEHFPADDQSHLASRRQFVISASDPSARQARIWTSQVSQGITRSPMRPEAQRMVNFAATGEGGIESSLPSRDQSGGAASQNAVVIAPARYVLLPLAHLLTGYSVKAIQRKIERGDWPEGKVWRHAPDGHVVVDMMGYERWVEGR
jgi:hypothetical protein